MWSVNVVAHATTMPLFVINGIVHFGSHPFADVVAWGGEGATASRGQTVRGGDRRRAATRAASEETEQNRREIIDRMMARDE